MRRRRRKDIIIELTSLLDVIMIMIFMVMGENSKLVEETQSDLKTAQEEKSQLQIEYDDTYIKLQEALGELEEGDLQEVLKKLRESESKLNAYEYMNDVVTVINIELKNNSNNTVRYLTYGDPSDYDAEQNQCEIRSNDELNTAIDKMKVFIHDYKTKSDIDILYVIFSFDPKNVFQDDYAAINEALKKMENISESSNFRYRINPVNED